MTSLDLKSTRALNQIAERHDLFGDPMRFLAYDSPYVLVALLVVLFVAARVAGSLGLRRGVAAALLSTGLALGVAQVVSQLVRRTRPFIAHPSQIHVLVPTAHDFSFPSDHATAALAIAFAMLLRSRRAGGLLVAFGLFVMLGRVAVGAHYPSDVVTGAMLGGAAALVTWIPGIRALIHLIADSVGSLQDRLVSRIGRSLASARW